MLASGRGTHRTRRGEEPAEGGGRAEAGERSYHAGCAERFRLRRTWIYTALLGWPLFRLRATSGCAGFFLRTNLRRHQHRREHASRREGGWIRHGSEGASRRACWVRWSRPNGGMCGGRVHRAWPAAGSASRRPDKSGPARRSCARAPASCVHAAPAGWHGRGHCDGMRAHDSAWRAGRRGQRGPVARHAGPAPAGSCGQVNRRGGQQKGGAVGNGDIRASRAARPGSPLCLLPRARPHPRTRVRTHPHAHAHICARMCLWQLFV